VDTGLHRDIEALNPRSLTT